jgi:hypothetical protein
MALMEAAHVAVDAQWVLPGQMHWSACLPPCPGRAAACMSVCCRAAQCAAPAGCQPALDCPRALRPNETLCTQAALRTRAALCSAHAGCLTACRVYRAAVRTRCARRYEDEAEDFLQIDEIQKLGIAAGDIKKLKDAGMHTIKAVCMVTKKVRCVLWRCWGGARPLAGSAQVHAVSVRTQPRRADGAAASLAAAVSDVGQGAV